MILSTDLMRAIDPEAMDDMLAEFDAHGTLHLIKRDDDGNDVKDIEVAPKTFVDTSDIPSIHARIEVTRKKARMWKIIFYSVLGVIASLLTLAVTIVTVVGV